MVCPRCIKVVKDEFEKLELNIEAIELGKVSVSDELSSDKLEKVRSVLDENGFELIDDKKNKLIESIRTLIIEEIHYANNPFNGSNSSDFIAKKTGHDYSYLSNLFSSIEGITIEKYIIRQKIEKVKELLIYDELSLNEISYQMGYSSVQHLSNQFKKITGMTPSQFKKLKENRRTPLDEV